MDMPGERDGAGNAGVDGDATVGVSCQEESGVGTEGGLDPREPCGVSQRVLRDSASVWEDPDEFRCAESPHGSSQIVEDGLPQREIAQTDRLGIPRPPDHDAQEALSGGSTPGIDARVPEDAET